MHINQERIPVPTRPAETAEFVSDEFQVSVSPATRHMGPPETWCLYAGPAAGEKLLEPPPYILASWLLKERQSHARDLISPYAKLELSREARDARTDAAGRYGLKYGFRLVGLELLPAPEAKPEQLELVEFKLIAGNNSFVRRDDKAALFTYTTALSSFRLGVFSLRHAESWEKHFS